MHMTCHRDWLHNYKIIRKETIRTAGDEILEVLGKGDIRADQFNDNRTTIWIRNVYYVPNLSGNLISTCQLLENGYMTVVDSPATYVKCKAT